MADAVLYQGAVAPATFKVSVKTSDLTLDLTTVTGASLLVKQIGTGSPVTWAAAFSNATTSTIDVTHTMALGDTVGPSGTFIGPPGFEYTVVAVLTLPGGTIRSVPVSFLHSVLQP